MIVIDRLQSKISKVVVIIGLGLSFGSVMLINLYKHFIKRPPPPQSPQTDDANESQDCRDEVDEVDLMKFKLATDDQICEILLKPLPELSISTEECDCNEEKYMKYEDGGLTISKISAASTNISSSLFTTSTPATFLSNSTTESHRDITLDKNEISSDDNNEYGDNYHESSDVDIEDDVSQKINSTLYLTSFHDDIYKEISLSSCKQLLKCTRRPSSSTINRSLINNKNFNNNKTYYEDDTNSNEISLKSNLVSDLDYSLFRWGQSLSDSSPISTADLTLLNILLEGPNKLFIDSSDITGQLDVIERDLGKLKLETNELVEVFEIFKKKAIYNNDVKINNSGINYSDVDVDCFGTDYCNYENTEQATVAIGPYVSTPKSFLHTTEHKFTLAQDHQHLILPTSRRLLPQPPSIHTVPNFCDQLTISPNFNDQCTISTKLLKCNNIKPEEAFISKKHSSCDDSLSAADDVHDVMFDEWDYDEELGGADDDDGGGGDDITLILSPDFRVHQLLKQTLPGRDDSDDESDSCGGGDDGDDDNDDGLDKLLLLKSSSASTQVVQEICYEKNENLNEIANSSSSNNGGGSTSVSNNGSGCRSGGVSIGSVHLMVNSLL